MSADLDTIKALLSEVEERAGKATSAPWRPATTYAAAPPEIARLAFMTPEEAQQLAKPRG